MTLEELLLEYGLDYDRLICLLYAVGELTGREVNGVVDALDEIEGEVW